MEEKARREGAAMAALGTPAEDGIDVAVVLDRWKEYEDAASAEAVFVRDMNVVDMCVQALPYERDRRYDPGASLAEFPSHERMDELFASARSRLATDVGRRSFATLDAAYRTAAAVAP